MEKYKLTDKKIEKGGHTLYRIKAVSSFGKIRAGDLGGFIESYNNLSQTGTCWVGTGSKVFGVAKILDSATIDNATVSGSVKIAGNSYINKCEILSDDNRIFMSERYCFEYYQISIWGNAIISESKISGKNIRISHSEILAKTVIRDDTTISNCKIKDCYIIRSKLNELEMNGKSIKDLIFSHFIPQEYK